MILEVERPQTRENDGLAPKFLNERPPLKRCIVDGVKEGKIELQAEIVEGKIFDFERIVLFKGTEPISIRWIHDRVELEDSLAFRFKRSSKDAVLLIADAFPEDSGEYVCVAENKYGVAHSYIQLFVTGKLIINKISFSSCKQFYNGFNKTKISLIHNVQFYF